MKEKKKKKTYLAPKRELEVTNFNYANSHNKYCMCYLSGT